MERRKTVRIVAAVAVVGIVVALAGCAWLSSRLNDLKGSLIGNRYTIETYDNYGALTFTATGNKIDLEGNTTTTGVDVDGNATTGLTSVVTVTIDGSEIETCGDTCIFIEDGLEKEVDFTTAEFINTHSETGDITDNTILAYTINQYKNYFGKSRIVVIKSQMGQPLCAFSGDKVYWEIPDDLPKTTKLMIDGKALYIHRANFQIIDKDLL